MPGTDLCIKIGGWIRAEAMDGQTGGSFTWGPFAGVQNNRTTNNLDFRARGYITADVRNQTEYGTIRGYISVGISSNDTGLTGGANAPPTEFSSNRAFVQFAGLTAGLSQSFYDFYSTPAMQYRGGFTPASDTGDPGWVTFAYTAQLGGGFSATIAAEERRTEQVIDASGLNGGTSSGNVSPGAGFNIPVGVGAGVAATGIPGNLTPGNGAYGGFQAPDVIGNLRVDQAWGGAQIMGALHELNPLNYSTAVGVVPSSTSGSNLAHASDSWGWAAGAGLKLNLPMITQGDWFQAQVNVTQGALGYAFFSEKSNWGMTNGAQEAFGVLSDCVYGGLQGVAASQTSCQKTSAWGVNAGFEHYWTPSVHESFYGDFYQVNYGSTANAMLCSFAGAGNGAGTGTAAVATAGCNNNWSTWAVGSRLQWDVTKSFYLGVEVLYTQLKSATVAAGTGAGGLGGFAGGGALNAASSASAWVVGVRAHRDFLP